MKLTATIFTLAALAGLAVADAAQADSKPANILLITVDDMNCDSIGKFGCRLPETSPHIDRLAEQGVRFTQHYSGSPVCAPSRCVLLTGLHTGHAYIRDNDEMPGVRIFS